MINIILFFLSSGGGLPVNAEVDAGAILRR